VLLGLHRDRPLALVLEISKVGYRATKLVAGKGWLLEEFDVFFGSPDVAVLCYTFN
jgi:hypothetical protein